MAIYYDSEKEIKNATATSNGINISINGCYVADARNTKTIREQVFNMMNVAGMKCVAMTTFRAVDEETHRLGDKTTAFWFASPEHEAEVVEHVVRIYSSQEGGRRTYFL